MCAAPAAAAPDFTGATFTEFTGGVAPGFSAGGQPSGATLGPDGNVWFAEQAGPGRIARVTPSGAVTELTGGVTANLAAGGRPANLATGPDGNVWVTGFGDPGRIWKVTPAGAVTEVAFGGQTPGLPADSQPTAIVAGPGDELYFTEFANPGRVAKITTAGVVSTVATGGGPLRAGLTADSQPRGLALGPDGNLWVAEFASPGRIARVTPGGGVTEFTGGVTPGFSVDSAPLDIVAGPDGNLWFTEQASPGRIARITPSGVVTEFSGFTADRQPTSITKGPDGNLWFTEASDPGGIGRITTAGVVTEFPAAATPAFSRNRAPTTITPGAGDSLWFTESNAPGAITRIAAAPAGAPAPPAPPSPPPASTPSPPPPGPGPPDPPPVAAPRVTRVAAVTPVVAGRPALLSAQVAGSAERVEWDLDSDGKTDVSCTGGRSTLRFRPPAGTAAGRAAPAIPRFAGRISVHAVGVGGAGPTFTQVLAVAPAAAVAGDAAAVKRVSALVASEPPVYACGDAKDLAAAKTDDSIKADFSERTCVPREIPAGALRVEGCVRSVHALEEIPAAERGIVLRDFSLLGRGGGTGTDVARLAGVAFTLTDAWVAVGVLRVNGVDVSPRGAARLVFYPQLNEIVSSSATMSLGGIRFITPPEPYFSLDTTPVSGGRVPIGNLPRDVLRSTLKRLDGFRLAGDVGIVLDPAGAQITLGFQLPDEFSLLGGAAPTARAVLRATNADGLILDGLSIRVPEANLGALRLTDLSFDYLRKDPTSPCAGRSSWRGGGNLLFGPTGDAGLKLAPPPTERGIGFCGSSLAYAGGQFTFGGLVSQPQIYPGVFLKSIGLGIGLEPTRFRGDAEISVAQVTDVAGTLLTVFATPEHPYTLTDADAGGTLAKIPRKTFTQTTFAVGGNASMTVPLLGKRIELGGGYLVYAFPDYVAVGGTTHLGIPGGYVDGSTAGEVGISRAAFNLEVSGRTCTVLCYGATGLISSAGVAGCGRVSVDTGVFGEVVWKPGLGWRYGDSVPTIYLDGCDVAPFRADVAPRSVRGSRAAPSGPGVRSFTVRRGVPHELVRLLGADGAPSVEVRAPDGTTVNTARGDLGYAAGMRILRSRETKATFIDVKKPGTYTIAPLAGSPPVAGLATADGLPPARVAATVTGRGAHRTLAFDVAPRTGQKVTFVERGPSTDRVLATVRSGKGTLRFAPGPGQAGGRQIIARIALGGLAHEEPVVARFTVGAPRKPGRPRRVRVRRTGATISVSWGAAGEAARYAVTATPRFGAQKLVRTGAGRRRVQLRGIAATQAGTIAVRALSATGDAGAAVTKHFAATRATRSRFRVIAARRPR